ncbi:MAG: hypothetical protein NC311_01215 [Muribaculaceae bacterium]|nr:hypothetical protein [Muribaculaceae bacterium]
MKTYIVAPVLILAACGGLSREKFYQDKENAETAVKITQAVKRTSDCDKLGQLYEFAAKDSPSVSDLEKILPLLDVKQKDFKNIDKLYSLDYSVIDKYQCTDNRKSLRKYAKAYCSEKYYDEYGLETALYFPFRLVSTVSVLTIVGAIPFTMHSCGIESAWHPIACHRKLDCDTILTETVPSEDKDYSRIKTNDLKTSISNKIKNIYPIPRTAVYYDFHTYDLNNWFNKTEIALSNKEHMGVYDGQDCYIDLPYKTYRVCDDVNTKIISRWNAAQVVWDFCVNENSEFIEDWVIDKERNWEKRSDKRAALCGCVSHSTYKNITLKNLLYIAEKDSVPSAKNTAYRQAVQQCMKELMQESKKHNKDRYGE